MVEFWPLFSLIEETESASETTSIRPQWGPVAIISYGFNHKEHLACLNIWSIEEISYIAKASYLKSSLVLTMTFKSCQVRRFENGDSSLTLTFYSLDVSKKIL